MIRKQISHKLIRIALYSLIPVLLSSCGLTDDVITSGTENPTESPTVESKLKENRGKWESKGIEDYRYNFNWVCFCVPDYVAPVSVTIRGGAVGAVTFTSDGRPVDAENLKNYHTIEGLFDLLQEAIDGDAHQISAEYDAEFGYPTKVWIDYDERIADEETGFDASGLVVLE